MPRADGCLRRNLKSGQRCITRRFLGLWVSTHACLRCLPPSTPLFRLGWGPTNVLFKLPPSFSYGLHLGSRFNIFGFCPPCHDDVYPFCIQDCGGDCKLILWVSGDNKMNTMQPFHWGIPNWEAKVTKKRQNHKANHSDYVVRHCADAPRLLTFSITRPLYLLLPLFITIRLLS